MIGRATVHAIRINHIGMPKSVQQKRENTTKTTTKNESSAFFSPFLRLFSSSLSYQFNLFRELIEHFGSNFWIGFTTIIFFFKFSLTKCLHIFNGAFFLSTAILFSVFFFAMVSQNAHWAYYLSKSETNFSFFFIWSDFFLVVCSIGSLLHSMKSVLFIYLLVCTISIGSHPLHTHTHTQNSAYIFVLIDATDNNKISTNFLTFEVVNFQLGKTKIKSNNNNTWENIINKEERENEEIIVVLAFAIFMRTTYQCKQHDSIKSNLLFI